MNTTVETSLSVPELYAQLRATGLLGGHRNLVFVSGSAAWCEAQLLSLPGALDNALLVANQGLCGLAPCQSENFLGDEFSSLIINAHNHQNLNTWLAAAGCLTAGGVLLLMCPRYDEWPGQFSVRSRFETTSVSYFISRLQRIAAALDGVYRWCQEDGLSGRAVVNAPAWSQTLPSSDQQATIAAIRTAATGRAKRPLIIRSDRGRGKTSALGLAVAALIKDQRFSSSGYRVLITAPSFAAVKAAFAQLITELPEAQWFEDVCQFDSSRMQYLPFENALKSRDQWDLVLVDEAAALPVAGLHSLLLRHSRIVFSTTVHGYEGSGRGFDIRFKAILDAERPQWRCQALHEPIRWAAGDPLEKALNRLFLLDAEPRNTCVDRNELSVDIVSRDELIDEDLLAQVFGLLVQAHYQTTPQDLLYLLDGNAVLVVARRGDCVQGVCQLLPEGGFTKDLCTEVVAGRRRPRGNLVAQRLAQQTAEIQYLSLNSLRINRIAVVGGTRRQGLGSALLKTAADYAKSKGLAYLSSSFAADPGIIDFWLNQGFSPALLGSRRDSASGLYSLIVLKSLNPSLAANINQLARQLNSDLGFSLASVYSEISPELLLRLLVASRDPASMVAESTIANVQRYCDGELFFEQAAASLARLCLTCDLKSVDGAGLAIARVLLAYSWSTLAEQYDLSGRADVELALKRIFRNLIATLE